MTYTMAIERLSEVYWELEPLYQEHYAEMSNRLKGEGIEISPYNPRLEEYFKADAGGWFITAVARFDGKPCGYASVYITNDMHNRDLISHEDVMFVTKAHRNGVGRKLMKFGLTVLKERGVKRFNVAAMTDPRVAHLWKRMGFKETAVQMTYVFRN